jgi:thymidylate synthase (FAD)
MKVPYIIDGEYSGQWVQPRYEENPYSRVYCDGDSYYITTNKRVILENGWEEDVQDFGCDYTEFHKKRVCVKITTSRGISHELVRHRVFSFIQSSQRYCNYSLGKFNKELTYVIPEWIYAVRHSVTHRDDGELLITRKYLYELDGLRLIRELSCEDRSVACWLNSLVRAEIDYMFLTTTDESYKLTPQEARGILPNDCMTEICMTGFVDQWKEFFKLRCASDAHPDMQVIANMIENEFIKRNYLNE